MAANVERRPSVAARARVVSLDFDDTLVQSEAMKRQTLVAIAAGFPGGEAALATIPTDARTAKGKVTRHTIMRDLCAAVPAAAAVGEAALVDRYSAAVRAGVADAREVPGASRPGR